MRIPRSDDAFAAARKRRCAAALRAISQLQSESFRPSSLEFSNVAHLCECIERDVGSDAGIGEKLGVVLGQAWRLQSQNDQPAAVTQEARLLYASSVSSLSNIIDRLSPG
jgi:hypothetical protein